MGLTSATVVCGRSAGRRFEEFRCLRELPWWWPRSRRYGRNRWLVTNRPQNMTAEPSRTVSDPWLSAKRPSKSASGWPTSACALPTNGNGLPTSGSRAPTDARRRPMNEKASRRPGSGGLTFANRNLTAASRRLTEDRRGSMRSCGREGRRSRASWTGWARRSSGRGNDSSDPRHRSNGHRSASTGNGSGTRTRRPASAARSGAPNVNCDDLGARREHHRRSRIRATTTPEDSRLRPAPPCTPEPPLSSRAASRGPRVVARPAGARGGGSGRPLAANGLETSRSYSVSTRRNGCWLVHRRQSARRATMRRRHSFRACSGPVIRSRSGKVEAMIASEQATPPRTVAQ